MLCDSTPRFVSPSIGPSVRLSVHPSVTLLFLGFCGLRPHCSCPSDQVTSNTAPAYPHATGVAVYPALLYCTLIMTGFTTWEGSQELANHIMEEFWQQGDDETSKGLTTLDNIEPILDRRQSVNLPSLEVRANTS